MQTINTLGLAFQSTFHLVEDDSSRLGEIGVGGVGIRYEDDRPHEPRRNVATKISTIFSTGGWWGGLQTRRLSTFEVLSFMDEWFRLGLSLDPIIKKMRSDFAD